MTRKRYMMVANARQYLSFVKNRIILAIRQIITCDHDINTIIVDYCIWTNEMVNSITSIRRRISHHDRDYKYFDIVHTRDRRSNVVFIHGDEEITTNIRGILEFTNLIGDIDTTPLTRGTYNKLTEAAQT